MKKLISAVLVAVILFSVCGFAGCSLVHKKLFTLSSEVSEVAAGEEFSVVIKMDKINKLACLQYSVTADGEAEILKNSIIDDNGLVVIPNASKDILVMSAMVATVIDIEPFDFQKITFKVGENAKPGDVITVKLDVTQVLVGLDVRGDNTDNITDTVSGDTLTVKVK